MSNIYFKITIETFSKLLFSGFKKLVTRSVFGELRRFKVKESIHFVEQKYKLETKRKWKIPHTVLETNQLIYESQIKSRIVMSWSS